MDTVPGAPDDSLRKRMTPVVGWGVCIGISLYLVFLICIYLFDFPCHGAVEGFVLSSSVFMFSFIVGGGTALAYYILGRRDPLLKADPALRSRVYRISLSFMGSFLVTALISAVFVAVFVVEQDRLVLPLVQCGLWLAVFLLLYWSFSRCYGLPMNQKGW